MFSFFPPLKTTFNYLSCFFFVVVFVLIINNQLAPGGIRERTRHARGPPSSPSRRHAAFGV